MAYTTVAFGFVPTGGFVIGHHSTFDRTIPHKFMLVPKVHRPITINNEGIVYTPPVMEKSSQLPKAPKLSVVKPQKTSKARGSAKVKKATVHASYKLSEAEKKHGWKLPSKKQTTRRKSVIATSKYSNDNSFAVLGRLFCSQKRELDQTGTLRMPTKKDAASKRRKLEKASVYMTSPTNVNLRSQAHSNQRVTRSMARSMPKEFEHSSLSSERTARVQHRQARGLRRIPTASAYMADDDSTPPTLEDLIKMMITRLDRVETELSNLTSKNTTETGTSQAGPSTMLPMQQPNIQSSNLSSTTSPSFAAYVQEPGVTQPSSTNNKDEVKAIFNEALGDWLKSQNLKKLLPIQATHNRPYPAEVEAEPFPSSYNMPSVEKFNGRGNPDEHLDNYIAKLGNLASNPNYCLRLFGSSLTGNAFQWYLTIPNGSVKTWEDMKRLFKARFFVTEKDVTIADLSNLQQRNNETVDAYIDRWQIEASKCREEISEESQVQLCRNGMKSELSLLISEQITTFKILANEATRKEHLLMQHKAAESRMERMKKEANFRMKKKEGGESSANVTETKGFVKNKIPRRTDPEPNYPFTKEEVYPIFKELLQKNAIVLPEPRNPTDANEVNHPKYCHYHRGIHHPTSECITLRRIILACIKNGIVVLKDTPQASSNNISAMEEPISKQNGWDLIYSRDVQKPRRRRNRHQKNLLQKMREAWMRVMFPYEERYYRWSSKHSPYTLGDYMRTERLRPFYRGMIHPNSKKIWYSPTKYLELLRMKRLPNPTPQKSDEELFWSYPPTVDKLPLPVVNPSVVTCYHIDAEMMDEERTINSEPVFAEERAQTSQSTRPARVQRRIERQRENRRRGYTKFSIEKSPVMHLLQFAHECCGKSSNSKKLEPMKLASNFGKSMGPTAKTWFQTSTVRAIKEWNQLLDLFLLRFLASRREDTREAILDWIQYPGEDTSTYIHKWRSAAWSDPQTLCRYESDDVRLCLKDAAFYKERSPPSFIKTIKEAHLKRMKAPPRRFPHQIYMEKHIRRVIGYLKSKNAAYLNVFPNIRRLEQLKWPMHILFQEDRITAFEHLFRYQQRVKERAKGNSYALKYFPFSLASHSQALRWFAKLPAETFRSWEALTEAFMVRFHEYTTEIPKTYMQTLRILKEEQPYDYVLRWVDTRLWCEYQQGETQMVKECISSLGASYDPAEEIPINFLGLLNQVHRQQPQLTCNVVTTNNQPEIVEEVLAVKLGKPNSQEKELVIEDEDPMFPPGFEELAPKKVDYDVIAHLRRLPARLSIYDALQLSNEARTALIKALMDESVRDGYLAEAKEVIECDETITFTDDDLLLGDKEHNRPLFVSGNLAGEQINRILLDAGSAVNILPLKTLKRVGLSPAQLKHSNLVIQGFNQASQRAMGVITLDLDIQGFLTRVVCHVVNAPTSYNLLLGRPWMHRNKVVASTMHQCFKYFKDGAVQRVAADMRPFMTTESFYSDAQYFELAPIMVETKKESVTATKEQKEKPPTIKKEALLSSQPQPTSRFKVTKDVTSEERMKLMEELAKFTMDDDVSSGEPTADFPQKPAAFHFSSPSLLTQQMKTSKPLYAAIAEKGRGRGSPKPSQGRGQAIPPPIGLYPNSSHNTIMESTSAQPSCIGQSIAATTSPISKFRVVTKQLKLSQPSQVQQKTSRWVVSAPTAQCLAIEYNWPLPLMVEPLIIQKGLHQPTEYCNIQSAIFLQCGRPYGNPGISKLLPTKELRAWELEKYSPQSRRIMDLQGFYSEEPHASGYGFHIPIPLSHKLSGYREPGDYSGLGYEDIDEDNNEKYTPVYFPLEFRWIHNYQDAKESASRPQPSEKASTTLVEDFCTSYCITSCNNESTESFTYMPCNSTQCLTTLFEDDQSTKDDDCTISQPSNDKISENDTLQDDEISEIGYSTAPTGLEDGGQPTIDELEEFDLGNSEDKRPIFIAKDLPKKEKQQLMNLLREFKDVFAWTYSEMPGIDPNIAMHHLHISSDKKPVKQAPRKFRPDLEQQIIQEIDKLIEANFIREVKFPKWISSIVPVKKKNGQIRICVDFRDLNEACPKDEFPLPHMELLIDSTSLYDTFSFMDGYSGYNQIQMAPEDEESTAFRTPMGIFCYKVMPFGLKNAGATYQRAMQVIFHDMLHKHVECYIDDLVVRSNGYDQHQEDLQTVFKRLRKNNLRMNPLKCAFGVKSGKFLGFVVRHRGIEIDSQKIEAIQNMPPPKNIKELRGLQGKLSYIRRFISNLAGRCQPFHSLLKKDVTFKWDETCQKAFDAIKDLLQHPPVLAAPIKGKPLILYISTSAHALGALLAQENAEKKEQALYYLSRRLIGAEYNYSPIEKTCLALVFAAQKLRHYFLAHEIKLISKADPLKFLITKPMLSGRLAKWSLLLSEFDITYIPQKAVKGQALADFLADHPVNTEHSVIEDLPDEEVFLTQERTPWQMYFDGAAKITNSGVGIVFISPQKDIMPYSFYLGRKCTNNEAEYEALVIGLQLALDFGIDKLDIFGDSELVVRQLTTEYEVRQSNLRNYYDMARILLDCFYDVKIQHVPRMENNIADALANLATALAVNSGQQITVKVEHRSRIPDSYMREEEN